MTSTLSASKIIKILLWKPLDEEFHLAIFVKGRMIRQSVDPVKLLTNLNETGATSFDCELIRKNSYSILICNDGIFNGSVVVTPSEKEAVDFKLTKVQMQKFLNNL